MLIVTGSKRLSTVVAAVVSDVSKNLESQLSGIRSVTDLSTRVRELREQVEKLETEKARRLEEFERKEREIEHKIGLERKRQEFEITAGKREAVVAVREENLAADRKRFEEQMHFHDERFTAEVGYLKDTLAEVLKRLPSAEFTADLTPSRRR